MAETTATPRTPRRRLERTEGGRRMIPRKEAAALLGLSEGQFDRAAKQGTIRTERLSERRLYVPADELDRLLAAREAPAVGEELPLPEPAAPPARLQVTVSVTGTAEQVAPLLEWLRDKGATGGA